MEQAEKGKVCFHPNVLVCVWLCSSLTDEITLCDKADCWQPIVNNHCEFVQNFSSWNKLHPAVKWIWSWMWVLLRSLWRVPASTWFLNHNNNKFYYSTGYWSGNNLHHFVQLFNYLWLFILMALMGSIRPTSSSNIFLLPSLTLLSLS